MLELTLPHQTPQTAPTRQIQSDLTDAALKIPEYYYAPIHAYADGNLCWDSAMEVQCSQG